ncbi:hypothetical protein [Nocardia brevicatena]|uniref:hypothetical protein n=1 Tax=Nocardia brevicatena TaxID=37327 RepID=UPI0002FED570|nr:hypothetical protein [Nocardia brevicatena]
MTVDKQARPVWRTVLAMISGAIAIWAFAGAAGVATGLIEFGAVIDSRLPWDSEPFAAVMLALVVGMPMAATSWLAGHGRRSYPAVAIAAGSAAIAWILVQLVVIRTVIWVQPLCVALSVIIVVLGLRLRGTASTA